MWDLWSNWELNLWFERGTGIASLLPKRKDSLYIEQSRSEGECWIVHRPGLAHHLPKGSDICLFFFSLAIQHIQDLFNPSEGERWHLLCYLCTILVLAYYVFPTSMSWSVTGQLPAPLPWILLALNCLKDQWGQDTSAISLTHPLVGKIAFTEILHLGLIMQTLCISKYMDH